MPTRTTTGLTTEERMALLDNSEHTPSLTSYRCRMTMATGGDSTSYLGDETYTYSPSSRSTLSRRRGLRRSTASLRTYTPSGTYTHTPSETYTPSGSHTATEITTAITMEGTLF